MSGRRRTNQQSQGFKAKIADLKKQGRTDAEIARQLGVTGQYVSQFLLQEGLAGGRRDYGPMKPKATSAEVLATIDRLEREGESVLAQRLWTVVGRRNVKRGPDNGKKKG